MNGGAAPRVLAIMGSGETAAAMTRVHRSLLARVPDGAATLLDTTYGFQENADEISERMVEFFRENLGRSLGVASFRDRDANAVDAATAVARIRASSYVLAGPGSPSFALRQWIGSPIPTALADLLASGGIVTMASAAALTLGVHAIPVYEIYKVGEDPRWLDGLDLLGPATGLRAAVVPHYDNNEGGTHDTRFCYVGERRLRAMERELPDDVFILGVDGHTALVFDLSAGTADVLGLGGVTIRVAGRSAVIGSGSSVPIASLRGRADALRSGRLFTGMHVVPGPLVMDDVPAADGSIAAHSTSGTEGEERFGAALAAGDARAALAALIDLDEQLEGRLRRGEDSPDLDGDLAVYRALLVRLADAAAAGLRDRREVVDPFIETILELRSRARSAHDWVAADLIRDRLAAAGVEVRDGSTGPSWYLEDEAAPAGDIGRS
jgi:hypothetical protein